MADSALARVTEEGGGTAGQRARRQRILVATVALAAQGGYEAVQMREVADKAGVALGTLYRYFPSKVHLLVSAMGSELDRLMGRMGRHAIPGDTPYDRVLHVLRLATRSLQREPELTAAMVRALMVAGPSVAAEVDNVGRLTSSMICQAIRGGEGLPADAEQAIVRVLENVWLASVVSWLSGRVSAEQVWTDLELATRLLLPPTPATSSVA